MDIKSLLENPNGGQLFSGYVVLLASIAFCGGVGFLFVQKLVRGEPFELAKDLPAIVFVIAASIPGLIKFVRSRHAR